MVKKIMFICTGNTCRSAMAVYIGASIAQKAYFEKGYIFDSAGLMAAENAPAAAEAVSVLGDRCIELKGHRSKPFSREMADEVDLIVAMTKGHKEVLLQRFPNAKGKTYTLGELSGSNIDITDPYCGSYEVYAKSADILIQEIGDMFENLENLENNRG